jgi:uncharacterized membrane protein YfcA
MFLGMPFGLALFRYADETVLRAFLGVSTLAMVGLLARGVDLSGHGRALDWSTGAAAGVLSTSLSTNGPPLVFVLQGRRLTPDQFRATIATLFTVSGIVSLVARAAVGGFTRPVLVGVAVAPLPLLTGIAVGVRLRRRIDPARFARVVLVLLAAAALTALAGALTG